MKSITRSLLITLTALSAMGFAESSSAWIRGGIFLSEPVYLGAPAPYYAYPAYPVAYPAPYYPQPAPYYPQPEPYAQPALPAPQAAPAYSANPDYCREYSHTITVNGERRQAYGHACQQPDGNWKLMD